MISPERAETRSARARTSSDSRWTSSATTAKPRPCSPARAASMAALMARRWVCCDTEEMAVMRRPMSSARLRNPSTCAAEDPMASPRVASASAARRASSEPEVPEQGRFGGGAVHGDGAVGHGLRRGQQVAHGARRQLDLMSLHLGAVRHGPRGPRDVGGDGVHALRRHGEAARGLGDALGGGLHLHEHAQHLVQHGGERARQLCRLVVPGGHQLHAEVAARDLAGRGGERAQGLREAGGQDPGRAQTHGQVPRHDDDGRPDGVRHQARQQQPPQQAEERHAQKCRRQLLLHRGESRARQTGEASAGGGPDRLSALL